LIRIKGIRYKVVPLLEETHGGDDSFFLLGQIQKHKATIGVRMHDTDEQVQKSSFIHEAVHDLVPPEIDDERLVDTVAANLYAFLVDNDLLKDGWWDNILDDKEEGIRAIYVDDGIRELDGTKKEGVAG
jgi:hypothetical protein